MVASSRDKYELTRVQRNDRHDCPIVQISTGGGAYFRPSTYWSAVFFLAFSAFFSGLGPAVALTITSSLSFFSTVPCK